MIDVAIKAVTLSDAFDEFCADWWNPEMTRSFGVWFDGTLIARVVPYVNKKTRELEPHIEMLNSWS